MKTHAISETHVLVWLVLLFLGEGCIAPPPQTEEIDAYQVAGGDRPRGAEACGYDNRHSSMQSCLGAQGQCLRDRWLVWQMFNDCDMECNTCSRPATATGLDASPEDLRVVFVNSLGETSVKAWNGVQGMVTGLLQDGYQCLGGADGLGQWAASCTKVIVTGVVITVSVVCPPAGVAILAISVVYQGTECVASAFDPEGLNPLTGQELADACAQLVATGGTTLVLAGGVKVYRMVRPPTPEPLPPPPSRPTPPPLPPETPPLVAQNVGALRNGVSGGPSFGVISSAESIGGNANITASGFGAPPGQYIGANLVVNATTGEISGISNANAPPGHLSVGVIQNLQTGALYVVPPGSAGVPEPISPTALSVIQDSIVAYQPFASPGLGARLPLVPAACPNPPPAITPPPGTPGWLSGTCAGTGVGLEVER